MISIRKIMIYIDSLTQKSFDPKYFQSIKIDLNSQDVIEHFLTTPGCLEYLLSLGFKQVWYLLGFI